ncbi:MAG: ribonuclease HI family protein [Candidatus Woesebacteria bacterium]|jgi:ribonuclease HI
MQQRITVGMVVQSGSALLLLKSMQGRYSLPLVGLDVGDDPNDILSSEVKKVFGAENVRDTAVCGVFSNIDKSKNEQTITIVYSVKASNGQPACSGEWIELSKKQSYKVDNLSEIIINKCVVKPVTRVTSEENTVHDVDKTTSGRVMISTDGGSRGNPGPSASGFVILNDSEETIYEGGKYLGITTNNQAEYQAVKLALEKALELGARVAEFKIDSLLIVNQMSGIYQIKNRDLWPIYTNIKDLISKFDKVTFKHVPRELNKEADAMVNRILDERK